MKAIRVHEFGGPSVMKLEDVPDLTPAAGQVAVRVHAVGVNPVDTYIRSGQYAVKPSLPYTPGNDAAGVVESIGEGVTSVKTGDAFTLRARSAEHMHGRLSVINRKCTGCPLT